jgi:hypothetical protein
MTLLHFSGPAKTAHASSAEVVQGAHVGGAVAPMTAVLAWLVSRMLPSGMHSIAFTIWAHLHSFAFTLEQFTRRRLHRARDRWARSRGGVA